MRRILIFSSIAFVLVFSTLNALQAPVTTIAPETTLEVLARSTLVAQVTKVANPEYTPYPPPVNHRSTLIGTDTHQDAFLLQATNAVLEAAGTPTLEAMMVYGRDPFSYRVVYLIEQAYEPTANLTSPETFSRFTSIKVAHTWDEVLAYDSEAPIEALIVHGSAAHKVNRSWMLDAPFRGLVFVAIDMPPAHASALFSGPCRAKQLGETAKEPAIYTFHSLAQFTDAQSRGAWFEAKYITCSKFKLQQGGSQEARGAGQSFITTLADAEQFVANILNDIDQANNSKLNFDKR